MRCENHDTLGNQCELEALVTIFVVASSSRLWGAAACRSHAWEAVAEAGRRVVRARADGDLEARIVATASDLGAGLLEQLQHGVTIGARWPLAEAGR